MKNIKNNRAFSLVEMLISIVVAAVLVLTIGVISSLSTSTYASLTNEAKAYNDITYGFKLMQNRVRASSSLGLTAASGSWVSQRVAVSAGSFGIYRDTTHSPATREFSFDNGVTREIIFSQPDPANSSAVLNLTATPGTNSVTVTISWTQNNVLKNMSTVMLKRAP